MPHEDMGSRRKRGLSPEKAKKMLHDDSAQGHPLTGKQKGYFGLIAGGGTPTKMGSRKRRKRRG